jgi:hypothetical protein
MPSTKDFPRLAQQSVVSRTVDTPRVKRWIKLLLKRKRGLVERNRMDRILWVCRGGYMSKERTKGRGGEDG